MVNLSRTASTLPKGYVFGFVKPISPNFVNYPPLVAPTLTAFGGKMLSTQSIADAVYSEESGGNKDKFQVMYVMQFPSVEKAVDWYHSDAYSAAKKLRVETSTGPLAIVEGPDFENYSGFLGAFIRIHDPVPFQKYAPSKTLAAYNAKRTYIEATEAVLSENFQGQYNAAVLIAFATKSDGKNWMLSEEYTPDRNLRLSTTSGPCAIIGKRN